MSLPDTPHLTPNFASAAPASKHCWLDCSTDPCRLVQPGTPHSLTGRRTHSWLFVPLPHVAVGRLCPAALAVWPARTLTAVLLSWSQADGYTRTTVQEQLLYFLWRHRHARSHRTAPSRPACRRCCRFCSSSSSSSISSSGVPCSSSRRAPGQACRAASLCCSTTLPLPAVLRARAALALPVGLSTPFLLPQAAATPSNP